MSIPFELPEDSFVGGTYKIFLLNALNRGKQLDLSQNAVWFSLSDYVNSDNPIVSKEANVVLYNDSYSMAKAELTPAETKDLKGKYIYQFTIVDQDSPAYCARGLVTIYRNIDKNALNK